MTLEQTSALILTLFEQVMQIAEFCQEIKIKFLNKKSPGLLPRLNININEDLVPYPFETSSINTHYTSYRNKRLGVNLLDYPVNVVSFVLANQSY